MQFTEARRYKELLKRIFPQWKEVGVSLRLISNPYDFGDYSSIDVFYNDQDPKQVELAFFMEGNSPLRWTDTEPQICRFSEGENEHCSGDVPFES